MGILLHRYHLIYLMNPLWFIDKLSGSWILVYRVNHLGAVLGDSQSCYSQGIHRKEKPVNVSHFKVRDWLGLRIYLKFINNSKGEKKRSPLTTPLFCICLALFCFQWLSNIQSHLLPTEVIQWCGKNKDNQDFADKRKLRVELNCHLN